MRAYAATDVGIARSINQDSVYYSTESVGKLPNLFVVADGMGGHKAGDVASRYTVERLVSLVKESEEKDAISTISNAIERVNQELYEKANSLADYEGMGTTLVVAIVNNNVLKVANVGDSRLYIVGDDITQVTRDHSLVEELVLSGKINRVEAKNHEKKNYITRAIGGEKSVEAEMFSATISTGDRIVMCSDGLTNMVDDEDIFNTVKNSKDIKEAVDTLVRMANDNGGTDNISVVIIEP